jgi:aquaporin Z
MIRKIISEFLGTYFLVFTATGAIIVTELTHRLTQIGEAIAAGFVLTALIYAFGHISGALFNPAVTIAFFINQKISKVEMIIFTLTQIVSSMLASVTLLILFGKVASLGITYPRGSLNQSFLLEFILTFFLITVILNSSFSPKDLKPFAGIAVGFTNCIESMFGGPISGASMNPARSIGPALISGNTHNLWIYIISPLLGGFFAAIIYKAMQKQGPSHKTDS